MKVLMLKTHADASGTHVAGKRYELPEALATVLIGVRAAQAVRPVKANAVEEKAAAVVIEPDDLAVIDGISEKCGEALITAGLSFEKIATLDVDEIKAVIKEAGQSRSAKNVETWAEQAKAMLTE